MQTSNKKRLGKTSEPMCALTSIATVQSKKAASREACYEIDLGAIRHNYRQLRRHLPRTVKIFACLKRNGYGCGAGPVARTLATEGADGFAVATLPDAMAIREMGIDLPVLLYPGPLPTSAKTIEALGLTVTVSSLNELESWRAAMSVTRIFVKADLGFFRAGATPQEIGRLLAAAHVCNDVEVQGLYAHLSELPTSVTSDASEQFSRLQRILQDAEASGTRPPIIMMSSTAGVLRHPAMDLDAVDPGALFIGLPETDRPMRAVTLRPALKAISTCLVSVKRIDASLGPIPDIPGFRSGMTIGVLGMGWGDGLPRHVPAQAEALVRGQRARLLPPAHLEHLRIDLTDVPDARFGDQVLLLGQQAHQTITHEEVAAQWGTDLIGLYAQLRDHIPRVYV
ncbi:MULTISPECIES: alanine racemase [Mesorhizobium]|uniref:alanine racemase n=1 Tax=Mesorhizobium TaxID=68287 RepID=UPI001CCB30CD|nr:MULTISPECIES: alanine racemase [Mesorhizobium]MCA0002771.1 alanine racemase [Mesorhizobium sp. B264B2A]MCA0009078.1 alanine racemase [Mesorhizobium sp. B264B1B]MCA0014525.1 alanine racemase [Mesorhizobium sp. B294B1A1]MCA0018218.1 alanine racemase [Mesorhizobium sp. B264B1A]MCA0024694.1 alanine racemase [Mesorhizobium sp. B263B1A]